MRGPRKNRRLGTKFGEQRSKDQKVEMEKKMDGEKDRDEE
jgi:hypothetical protein